MFNVMLVAGKQRSQTAHGTNLRKGCENLSWNLLRLGLFAPSKEVTFGWNQEVKDAIGANKITYKVSEQP